MPHRSAGWRPAPILSAEIPTILKINSANSLSRQKENADQAVTGSVDDAVRMGCAAIGFTIYPGSDAMYAQYEEFRELSAEAKSKGWRSCCGPIRAAGTSRKKARLAVDIMAYGAHMAALLGANIIKVKLPTAHLENKDAKKVYEEKKIPDRHIAERVQHIVQCCFNGRRIVVFSGGAAKGEDSVFEEARPFMPAAATARSSAAIRSSALTTPRSNYWMG